MSGGRDPLARSGLSRATQDVAPIASPEDLALRMLEEAGLEARAGERVSRRRDAGSPRAR
jgi:hypothetical protein